MKIKSVKGESSKTVKGLLIGSLFMFILSLYGSAYASSPENSIEFKGSGAGRVIFKGKDHDWTKGLTCKDCHISIFPFKKPGAEGAAVIKMSDIYEGRYCGACHNGKKAFDAKPKDSCKRCHIN